MTRPRVIIESRRTAAANALADVLVEAGLDPQICSGPNGSAGCPIFDGAPCALVEGADAVVYDLDLDRVDDRLVLRYLVIDHDGLPIITERSTQESRAHCDVLRQCTVVVPISVEHTAATVINALADASHTV